MSSPLLEKLIREFWDHGPFEKIGHWMKELSTQNLVIENALELGCGVGGLARVLKPYLKKYLGVDSSFASIALARHLNLGAPGPRGSIKIPEDLLKGWVSRPVYLEPAAPTKGVDFIVGDLNHLPLQESSFDLALDLNVIDMLDEPSLFPKLKNLLLKKNGVAVQSSPYVWSEKASNHLKKRLPPKLRDSALAVLHLYEQAGFKILKNDEHLPWLFFKNVRQLEIYSVHLFLARKSS
jgi:SAM-dependent methyltransferase